LDEAILKREPPLNRIVVWLERRRIRNHFRRVEVELRAREPRGLDSRQRLARSVVLGRLRDYRARGRFPRNLDFPGRRVPYVRGHDTTPCAVAHLIERSGGSAIVDDLASGNNNIWVEEIEDPRFDAWARSSGITKAEAARIQVPYMYSGPDPTLTALGLLVLAAMVATPLQIFATRIVRRFQPERTPRRALTLTGLLLLNLAVGMIVGMVLLWMVFGPAISLPSPWGPR